MSIFSGIGSVAKTVTSPHRAIGGGISEALGLSGKQGEYYQPTAAPEQNQLLSTAMTNENARQQAAGDINAATDIQNYGQGNVDLGSVLDKARQRFGANGQALNQFQESLASNPLTGSKLATEQVQNNPILGQLFGKGGALERSVGEEKDLATRGYSLKPEDYEAYGQASGDIARMFGQQEKGLSQSLADRGLAQGPSGAAAIGFSGLSGNKNEMLAKAQTAIADKRMQNNLARLNSVRQQMQALGSQGETAIQDQFGRNITGIGSNRADRALGLEAGSKAQDQALNQWKLENEMNMQSAADKRGAKAPSLGEAFGAGLMSSAGNIGAAPGKFVSSVAGSAGGGGGGGGGGSKGFMGG